MNTTAVPSNGKMRKSLASQIDRLDAILDGLADAIPEVVAETVRAVAQQTVRDVVQAAITEILTNPEILARLRAASGVGAASRATRPTLRQQLQAVWQRIRACASSARALAGAASRSLACGLLHIVRQLVVLGQRCKEARRYKFQLLSALAVGAALAVAAVCGGPWLASVTSGLGGFGSTLGMHAGLWWRRLCRTSTA